MLKKISRLLRHKTSSLPGQEIQQGLLYPRHVAIIMDGNGRWASKRSLPRLAGHKAGIDALKKIVRFCGETPIEFLTVFAFSTENWKRPEEEVIGLMDLLEQYLIIETQTLIDNGVKLQVIGNLDLFNRRLQSKIQKTIEQTKDNNSLTLNIALNYGGRSDIVAATKKCLQQVQQGEISVEDINELYFASQLSTVNMPDPDLLIRTSAEMRISNFLLWEIAYSEIWVTPVLWPDFNPEHFMKALLWFAGRERRFGGLKS